MPGFASPSLRALRRRLIRYGSVSAISTTISLIILGILVGLASFPAIWANVIAHVARHGALLRAQSAVGLGARRSAVPPPPSRPVLSPFVRRFGHLHLRGASGLWCYECLDAGGAHRRGRAGQRRCLRSSLGDSVRALRPHPVSFTPGPRRHRRPVRVGAANIT